jgi:glycosyltransferase involved in cell wall biosynthesis
MPKKTIVYFTRYNRSGPSSRLRSYQYKPVLEDNGYKVIICSLFNDQYIEELYDDGKSLSKWNIILCYLKRFFDLFSHVKSSRVLIVEKEFFPYIPAWTESFLRWLKIDYWLDVDDAVFQYYSDMSNPFLKFICGNKMKSVFSNASIVLSGNAYLKMKALEFGAKNVILYPTVIDVQKYSEIRECYESGSQKKTVLGWIGSPSTVKYLKPILPVIDQLSTQIDFEFHIVGSNSEFIFDNLKPKYIKWTERSEVASILGFDIGIMSLQDTLFEKGKCGYKLIQYFGCAKPVVASPIGVNVEIVDHEVNGFLATNDEDWKKYLTLLLTDSNLRKEMGDKGFLKVLKKYDVAINANLLIDIIEKN